MAMTIKTLTEELQKLNPDDLVVLSVNEHGTAFNFLEGIAINQILFEGKIYLSELTEELKDEGYTEEDVSTNGVRCVVLYPGVDTTLVETILSLNTIQDES